MPAQEEFQSATSHRVRSILQINFSCFCSEKDAGDRSKISVNMTKGETNLEIGAVGHVKGRRGTELFSLECYFGK